MEKEQQTDPTPETMNEEWRDMLLGKLMAEGAQDLNDATIERIFASVVQSTWCIKTAKRYRDAGWLVLPVIAARALRAIPSARRSEQSRINGRLGGRPRNRVYAYCPACGNVVYRIPGKRHGDGQQDTDDTPVWLLGDESDVDDVAALPDVNCGCTDH